MKGARILQLVAVVLVALYLLAFSNVNPDPLTLPLLPMVIPLPPVLIVALALVIGWLVGWLPANLMLWRQRRENRRLRRRIEDLEPTPEPAPSQAYRAFVSDRMPVIPDRPRPQADEEAEPS